MTLALEPKGWRDRTQPRTGGSPRAFLRQVPRPADSLRSPVIWTTRGKNRRVPQPGHPPRIHSGIHGRVDADPGRAGPVTFERVPFHARSLQQTNGQIARLASPWSFSNGSTGRVFKGLIGPLSRPGPGTWAVPTALLHKRPWWERPATPGFGAEPDRSPRKQRSIYQDPAQEAHEDHPAPFAGKLVRHDG